MRYASLLMLSSLVMLRATSLVAVLSDDVVREVEASDWQEALFAGIGFDLGAISPEQPVLQSQLTAQGWLATHNRWCVRALELLTIVGVRPVGARGDRDLRSARRKAKSRRTRSAWATST